MPKIFFLRGLPASGKSTWAKEQVQNNPHGVVRINKDDLRAMCHNSVWSKNNEKLICLFRDVMIARALEENRNVIVDDTNFAPEHLERVRTIAKEYNSEVFVKNFEISLEECIARDALRGEKSVGEEVIMKMYNSYLKPLTPEIKVPANDPNKRKCYVFDVDGTLAITGQRHIHDYSKVEVDEINDNIRNLLCTLQSSYDILVCSGRPLSCKDATLRWLSAHGILLKSLDHIYMRTTGDNRGDDIVKKELLDQIRSEYNIVTWFDDRDKVVKMLRENGVTVAQVNYGDF